MGLSSSATTFKTINLMLSTELSVQNWTNPARQLIVYISNYQDFFNYLWRNIYERHDSGDIFKYKLGKWVLSIDECAFMSLRDIGKNKSMRQYLIESVDSWVNKKETFLTDEFISEMCDFIKSENEDLYYRLMKKCALKGISVGEGIFEALNLLQLWNNK